MKLVLFPFEVYLIVFPLVLFSVMIKAGTTFLDKWPLLQVENQIHLMVAGYVLSIIFLAIGGIYAAIFMRNWKLMQFGLIYAGIGLFVLTYLILPVLAECRS